MNPIARLLAEKPGGYFLQHKHYLPNLAHKAHTERGSRRRDRERRTGPPTLGTSAASESAPLALTMRTETSRPSSWSNWTNRHSDHGLGAQALPCTPGKRGIICRPTLASFWNVIFTTIFFWRELTRRFDTGPTPSRRACHINEGPDARTRPRRVYYPGSVPVAPRMSQPLIAAGSPPAGAAGSAGP